MKFVLGHLWCALLILDIEQLEYAFFFGFLHQEDTSLFIGHKLATNQSTKVTSHILFFFFFFFSFFFFK
jgi:hypothetical protein